VPLSFYIIIIIVSPLRDILSGAIMAATSVPQLIAYAETVGYAGYRGLTTAGAPLLAWGVATGMFYMHYLLAYNEVGVRSIY
jgi:MFS superfamily sulfate permease-like transporter